MEIHGKPLVQYQNLPKKFNNYGQKVNGKDSWIDNNNELAMHFNENYAHIDVRVMNAIILENKMNLCKLTKVFSLK